LLCSRNKEMTFYLCRIPLAPQTCEPLSLLTDFLPDFAWWDFWRRDHRLELIPNSMEMDCESWTGSQCKSTGEGHRIWIQIVHNRINLLLSFKEKWFWQVKALFGIWRNRIRASTASTPRD
jgi:hypothetical protein